MRKIEKTLIGDQMQEDNCLTKLIAGGTYCQNKMENKMAKSINLGLNYYKTNRESETYIC